MCVRILLTRAKKTPRYAQYDNLEPFERSLRKDGVLWLLGLLRYTKMSKIENEFVMGSVSFEMLL